MAHVAGHLGVDGLQADHRGSDDASLARHSQVIWILAPLGGAQEVVASGGPRRFTGCARFAVDGPTEATLTLLLATIATPDGAGQTRLDLRLIEEAGVVEASPADMPLLLQSLESGWRAQVMASPADPDPYRVALDALPPGKISIAFDRATARPQRRSHDLRGALMQPLGLLPCATLAARALATPPDRSPSGRRAGEMHDKAHQRGDGSQREDARRPDQDEPADPGQPRRVRLSRGHQ